MEIKQTPDGFAIPLEEDELNAILLGGQFIAALGKIKRNGLDMIRDLNQREAAPVAEVQRGICHTGEFSTSIVLRAVAAAQAAHNELMLADASGTVH